uniref:Uncharacterized protein n=1 Tax=Gouania willdenowi TaxID=441366 RepID=A0A8C5DBP3_GOUWI
LCTVVHSFGATGEEQNPSCLRSSQWGGVSGPFSWYTAGPLMAIEWRLNATAYLNIAAGFSNSFQSYTPKGVMGTWNIFPMVTQLFCDV